MLSILIFLSRNCLCVDNFLALKIPLDVYSTSRGFSFSVVHFLRTCSVRSLFLFYDSSMSLIVLCSSFFHSVRPFAFLPITTAAASDGLVNI